MNALKTIANVALSAATLTALAAQAHASLCDADGVCYVSAGDSDSFGNSDFGLDYSFRTEIYNKDGRVEALQSQVDLYQMLVDMGATGMLSNLIIAQTNLQIAQNGLSDDHFKFYANGNIDVSVLGRDRSILSAQAGMWVDNGNFGTSQVLSVLGDDIDIDDPTSTERNLVSLEKTFVNVGVTIWAGGIPLSVRGKVTGELGIDGSASIGDGLSVNVDPYAILYGSASIGVGAACASAGVQGNLDLINVTMSNGVTFDYEGCGFAIDVESTLDMTTMDGSIELYAELCGAEWSEELVSWEGENLGSWDLYESSTCI